MNALCQEIINDATALDQQISGLEAQAAACAGRKVTAYAGLEKNQLFTQDKKIPFQWIQPGNTGNTGGGDPAKPHGTCEWVTGDVTLIKIAPAAPYDNFFFYSVLPYPTRAPSRLRWTAGNYSAKTPTDWVKSQQMEFQQEEFRDGFQYTCGWAVEPHVGLKYWAGKKKWQPFAGGTNIDQLIVPTMIAAEFSLDHTAHTYTYEWIVVNGVMIPVGLTVPAVPVPAKQEYSVAVQLDGNSSAQPYSAVLANLMAEWE